MDRRQVLAGFVATLTLGSGCLGIFENESTEDSSTETAGAKSPTAIATPMSSEPTGTETDQPPTNTPSQATQPSETSTGSTLIDPTNLATYASDSASYNIKYPANWRNTSSGEDSVSFTAPDNPARMLVRTEDGVPNAVPRETIIETAIQEAKQTYSLDQATRIDQKEVTLPNDIPATVVNMRVRRSSSDMLLRGTFLVAHVDDTVYIVGIIVPKRAHTPSVKRAMYTIVTSLTIQGAQSAHRDETDQ